MSRPILLREIGVRNTGLNALVHHLFASFRQSFRRDVLYYKIVERDFRTGGSDRSIRDTLFAYYKHFGEDQTMMPFRHYIGAHRIRMILQRFINKLRMLVTRRAYRSTIF